MSDSNTRPKNSANMRNLPSWMNSRQNASDHDKKKSDNGGACEESDESGMPKQAKGRGKVRSIKTHLKDGGSSEKSSPSNLGAVNFSKTMEGVVFVLSGFVNPERSVLRSQALEMGAEYQADWNSNCTLLVCAFPNTPKFRQVEADCGTIVSKEWISECYNQKKLVDIETYLMHAGKPWRKQSISSDAVQDQEPPASKKPQKKVEKKATHSKPTPSSSSKGVASNPAKDCFSPTKVKKWAVEDLNKTISWLECQDEQPDPSDIKKIAAEGILTCLQDAIDSLKQDQGIQHICEQWKFVPRVIDELAKLEDSKEGPDSLPKLHLYKQAMACKEIYETELGNLNDDSLEKKKRPKTGESKKQSNNADEYDSDETIEMTEDDIDKAYNTIASTLNAG